MCEVLGLSGGGGADVEATPKPGRSLNSARTADREARGPSVEVVSLRSTLEGKEQEIAAMRKELAALTREKRDLLAKVERLEKAAASDKAGLDVKQMERLEKEFEVQEQMLAGFQKENEKQALEVERLKTRCVVLLLGLRLVANLHSTCAGNGEWASSSSGRTVRTGRTNSVWRSDQASPALLPLFAASSQHERVCLARQAVSAHSAARRASLLRSPSPPFPSRRPTKSRRLLSPPHLPWYRHLHSP